MNKDKILPARDLSQIIPGPQSRGQNKIVIKPSENCKTTVVILFPAGGQTQKCNYKLLLVRTHFILWTCVMLG